MTPKYSAQYRIRVADADVRARVKLSSFLSILQEAASEHAEIIGVGRKQLLPRDLGWALSKLNVSFSRLPRWRERITVETWPSFRTRISTEREFAVFNEAHERIATARSLWVLFNLKARRLERLSELGEFPSIEEAADDSQFERPAFAPAEGAAPLRANFGVRKDDIDLNGHVNNAVYITWALEPLSSDFVLAHEPERLSLWFLSEVKEGDRLDAECLIDGKVTRHRILSGATEHARAEVLWREA